MAIEFDCPQCGKKLRTPDDAAGKQARCPHCGAVSSVPSAAFPDAAPGPFGDTGGAASFGDVGNAAGASSAGGVPSAGGTGGASPYSEGASGSPFAPTFQKEPAADTAFNPYASPPEVHEFQEAKGQGPMHPAVIELGEVLNDAWTAVKSQFGNCALFGLIVIGIQLAAQVVLYPMSLFWQELLKQESYPGAIAIIVVQQFLGLLVHAVVTCISIKFGVSLMRGSPRPIDGVFDIGPHYAPVLGVLLLLSLINVGIAAAILGPGALIAKIAGAGDQALIAVTLFVCGLIAFVAIAIVFFIFYLSTYFVVDREMSVLESMQASKTYMAGNKGATFGAMLIVGIAAMPLLMCTCYLGVIILVPYTAALGATIYLSATGQQLQPQPLAEGVHIQN